MNKKIAIFIIVAFILGIGFSLFAASSYNKLRPGIDKVRHKLENNRIANLPRAKEPLVISDFENAEDLKKWELSNAKIELSQEHKIDGKNMLKVYFSPSAEASGLKIEDFLEKNKNMRDWSKYEVISFNIYNPSLKPERMILRLKDAKGGKIKEEIYLEPNANNQIEIGIAELWGKLKPTDITQFNLMLWANKENKVLYLGSIRLLPAASLKKQNIQDAQFQTKTGEKIYATGDYFYFNKSKWGEQETQIPLVINNVLGAVALSGGIPFGRGELYSLDNLVLVDGLGNEGVLQAKVMSRWTDKSIKWVLIDFKPAPNTKYYLRYGGSNPKQPSANPGVRIEENNDNMTLDTGVLRLAINKRSFYLFDSVWLGNELVSSKSDLAITHDGKEYFSHLDKNYTLTVEENGPVKTCIKAKGWFVSERGEKFCQFIVRIYAYTGSSYLKVQHTLIYTGYPENKLHYLYRGKKLPKNETIEAIYIKTPVKLSANSKYTFAADNKIMQGDFSNSLKFKQKEYNTYDLDKNNQTINSGGKLRGWVDLSGKDGGVALGIKNFWQQFPKTFVLDSQNSCIFTYLWPKDAGELDLKTTEPARGPGDVARGSAFGLAKTHEVYLYFHRGEYEESQVKNTIDSLISDSIVIADPKWISDTGVMGKIWPYDIRLAPAEEFLSRLFDWGARQIKDYNWYGMIDFGDTLSWYRKEAYDKSYDKWGWHPEGRWGWFNCEAAGTHTGALIQFLRTGDYKYFNFGANLARHIMDIDTCHYNTVANDRRLKGVIPDDYSQVGSMHRHNGDHWGGRNEETSHTNVLGLVTYYYITGDERARDVVDEVGSFFLKGRVAYFGHPDIAPQRSIANALWSDVVLYELTSDEKYRQAADKWANLLYQGQRHDGSWAENYNPLKKRWEGKPNTAFMTQYTLPALIEYHKLTGNKAIAESIIMATDFLIQSGVSGAHFTASAYSYWLTGNKKYLNNIKDRIDFYVARQRRNDNSMEDGMVFQKAYYARVMEYLYDMPYAFEALANE